MKIFKTIAGYDNYKTKPGAYTALNGAGIPGFPNDVNTRDDRAFCDKKIEMLKDVKYKISTRNAIGENDRAAIESLYQDKSAVYITEYGYHVGEIKLPGGTAVAIISGYPNAEGKLEISAAFKDNKTNKSRKISLKPGFFEAASIILALMSLVKERQDEAGSTELVDALNDVLSVKNIEYMPYKVAGIIYYEFFNGEELDLGENFEAGSVREFNPKISCSTVGMMTDVVFGSDSFKSDFFNEESCDTSSTENVTINVLRKLSEKYAKKPRTEDEIKANFGWFSLPTEESIDNFTKVVKALTYAERFPNIKKAPLSMCLVGSSGTGKSTITEVASWLVGKEYRPVIASSEKFSESDLLATLVPVLNISDSELVNSLNSNGNMYLPGDVSLEEEYDISYMDIFSAPMIAYEAIYNKPYEGDFTPDIEEMCKELTRREIAKRLESKNNIEENSQSENGKFMMVLTEIGRTLLFGGVVEPQEYNMISNLNESSYFYRILEERMFTLPNGLVSPVHPDAHIVFTMNQSENFTRDMPPAFRNRHYMNIVFTPSGAETMAAQAVSTFEHYGIKLDMYQVKAMAFFMEKCRKFADYDELISLRALNNWILMSLDDESMYDSCIATVINVASSDNERINEMIGMLESSEFYDAGIKHTIISDEKL